VSFRLRFAIPVSFLLVACSSSPRLQPQATVDGRRGFVWPVKKAKLTQHFKGKTRRKHNGIDLAASQNTPIYAIGPGKVIYVGNSFRGFGKLVLIEHFGQRWASLYAHLNRFKVREGQSVDSEDLVGLMGRTGNASGTHLHFELRFNKRPVDPLSVLPRGALK